jgi:hypothetical protein
LILSAVATLAVPALTAVGIAFAVGIILGIVKIISDSRSGRQQEQERLYKQPAQVQNR